MHYQELYGMTTFMDAVRRYSGYTRFLAPAWAKYVEFVQGRPQTAAIVIVVLALLAIR
jgi:hypothetical protein